RPYLGANGKLSKLFDAFIQSSKAVTGDPAVLAAWWDIFQSMTQEGGPLATRFDARKVALVGRTHAKEDWAASHHSPTFDSIYNPHYRVLTYPLAAELLQQEKIAFKMI